MIPETIMKSKAFQNKESNLKRWNMLGYLNKCDTKSKHILTLK